MISKRFHLGIKEEFLNRNENMRLDAFVEILIKAVEEMSDSMDVKERRRFVTCPYRLSETHKKHKAAATAYQRNCAEISQTGQDSWQVQNAAHTKKMTVLDASCARLTKTDTDEALERLREMIAMMDVAIDTANTPQLSSLVPRSELT
ncbi:unnamed protein product [Nippostrongylus brasiliensis]|uniref:Uncharacterized protein n=1 Tax=Nippostrongylus brasiliensis TaxID=27835 RepID=A0A0N4XYP3_NIPBR|nr:unnamed protein product [Nippostrongylus brasiliensis]